MDEAIKKLLIWAVDILHSACAIFQYEPPIREEGAAQKFIREQEARYCRQRYDDECALGYHKNGDARGNGN